MSWSDFVDSVVKIGLGAFIAGGFSYSIARFNHNREEKRATRARRHRFLDDAMKYLAEFHRAYRHYHARRYDLSDARENGSSFTEAQREELIRLYDRLTDTFMNFIEIEQCVLALREEGIHARVLEYREVADKFQSEFDPGNARLGTGEITALDTEIGKQWRQLLRDIGSAYGVAA